MPISPPRSFAIFRVHSGLSFILPFSEITRSWPATPGFPAVALSKARATNKTIGTFRAHSRVVDTRMTRRQSRHCLQGGASIFEDRSNSVRPPSLLMHEKGKVEPRTSGRLVGVTLFLAFLHVLWDGWRVELKVENRSFAGRRGVLFLVRFSAGIWGYVHRSSRY